MSEPTSEGDADEPGQTDTGNARHSRAGHGQTQDGRSQTQSYPADRDEDGGIRVGDVVLLETVLGNRQL